MYASKNMRNPKITYVYSYALIMCVSCYAWVSSPYTKWYGGTTTRTVCAAAAAALCEHNRRPLPSMNYYLRGCPTGLEGQSVPGGHTCNIHPPPLVSREREDRSSSVTVVYTNSYEYELRITLLTNTDIFLRHPEFLHRFVSEAKIKNNSNFLIIEQQNSYISWCYSLKLRRLMVSCEIVLTQLTTRLKAKVCPEFLVGRDHLFLPF